MLFPQHSNQLRNENQDKEHCRNPTNWGAGEGRVMQVVPVPENAPTSSLSSFSGQVSTEWLL